jgi:hypothetical protein
MKKNNLQGLMSKLNRELGEYDLKCGINYICTISLKEIIANHYILRQFDVSNQAYGDNPLTNEAI